MRLRYEPAALRAAPARLRLGGACSAASTASSIGERMMAGEARLVRAVVPQPHARAPRTSHRGALVAAARRRDHRPRRRAVPGARACAERIRRRGQHAHAPAAGAAVPVAVGRATRPRRAAASTSATTSTTSASCTTRTTSKPRKTLAADEADLLPHDRRRTSTTSPRSACGTRSCRTSRTSAPSCRQGARCSTTAAASAPTACGSSTRATTSAFADFDNPSTRYLRWRLDAARPSTPMVYDVDGVRARRLRRRVLLRRDRARRRPVRLPRRNSSSAPAIVAVNFLEPHPRDVHLHRRCRSTRCSTTAERRGSSATASTTAAATS